jgi:hypothetical protein
VKLSAPQNIFLNELDTKFSAYVGGYGSGKTFTGCLDLLIFAGRNPGLIQGYFGPTYPSIRDIFYPTIEEAAHMMGFDVRVRVGDREVDLYRGGAYYGCIICRSMDNPGSIVGFKIARAMVDELDVLKKEKAKSVWRKIIARLRLKITGVENGVRVTTTPEGFGFVYEQFGKNPTKYYSMVQASTYENEEYLPDDYIPSLIDTYPKELINAYLLGNFCNLTSGTVYHYFDRKRHDTDVTWSRREPLHIGMDFNVANMSAAIAVIRGGDLIFIDEIVGSLDTPSIIQNIKERYPGIQINVYPDASGKNRNAQAASESSIQLLRAAGFRVFAPNKNPFVKDRVLSVNTALDKNRIKINTMACPAITENLEQQVYNDAGEPDKTHNTDHTNDGIGYLLHYKMPVNRPQTRVSRIA